jgi:uncharacterized membrane protein
MSGLCTKGFIMSIGMSLVSMLGLLKQRRCERCGLYYAKSCKKCIHCSTLDETQLAAFKEMHQQNQEGNNVIGSYFFFISLIIALLLLLSFL